MADALIIAGREFRSRLIVGTGKYKSFQENARALEAKILALPAPRDRQIIFPRRAGGVRQRRPALTCFGPPTTWTAPTAGGHATTRARDDAHA